MDRRFGLQLISDDRQELERSSMSVLVNWEGIYRDDEDEVRGERRGESETGKEWTEQVVCFRAEGRQLVRA